MQKATPRAPVMGDVAKLAGVSHQTVSRVLNDHPHIRPSTRAKVWPTLNPGSTCLSTYWRVS